MLYTNPARISALDRHHYCCVCLFVCLPELVPKGKSVSGYVTTHNNRPGHNSDHSQQTKFYVHRRNHQSLLCRRNKLIWPLGFRNKRLKLKSHSSHKGITSSQLGLLVSGMLRYLHQGYGSNGGATRGHERAKTHKLIVGFVYEQTQIQICWQRRPTHALYLN